jgi:hypothetical protein
MTNKEKYQAVQTATEALRMLGIPVTKSRITDVLVAYYGFKPHQLEGLKYAL